MLNRDNIINKIQKLLALSSNNPSAEEAAAAALKAQALIAEHDIQEEEIYEDAIRKEVVEVDSITYKGNKWAWYLATAIADNFRCRVLITKEFGIGNHMTFLGYDTDAQACSIVFNRLFEIGNKLANREAYLARKEYGSAAGVKGTFLVGEDGNGGFVGGIRNELEKQCQALMLVVPQEVHEYIKTNYKNLRSYNMSVNSCRDKIVAEHGFHAGKDAVKRTRIGEQKKINGKVN